MDTIKVSRQVRRVRLDDSPGSPVYEMDLGLSGVSRMQPVLGAAYRVIERFARGETVDTAALADAYTDVIGAAFGHDACREIVGYVSCGRDDPEDASIYLAPVVKYVFEQYADAVAEGRRALAEKHLEADSAR